MLKSLIIALIFAPTMGFADTTLDITYFQKTDLMNSNNTTALVCGVVTQDPVVAHSVQVIADPGNNETHYMVGLTPDGNFCHVVRARYGQVTVQLLESGSRSIVTKKSATIQ